MVMKNLPNKRKNKTPLDKINTLLLNGMNNYVPNKKIKSHKTRLNKIKISPQISSPLSDIIQVLTQNNRRKKRKDLKSRKGSKSQRGGSYTLSKLLKNQKEEVEIRCDNPPSATNMKFIKNLELHSDPAVSAPSDIILYLARFKTDNTGTVLSKNNNIVNVDKTLNVYGSTYHLSAVVIHSGSYAGGHYWTLAKRGNNKWVNLDDSKPPKSITDAEIQKQASGKTSGTNGVLFLYRKKDNIEIKYDDGTVNNGNGINNIGQSCYFNAALQFLITTDEYQDRSKMKKTRKALYDFLTSATEKTGGQDINDGTFLQGFGPEGKKDVKAFELQQGCQGDSHEALLNIFNYSDFKYNNTTPIIYIKNKKVVKSQYSGKPENIVEFTSNPPFYEYLFKETHVPKNNKQCRDKMKHVIRSIIVSLEIPSVSQPVATRTRTEAGTPQSSAYQIPAANTTNTTNTTNNSDSDKSSLDKDVIYSGKEADKYDHGTDLKKYQDLDKDGLSRVQEQFKVMSDIIPAGVTLSNGALVGKDVVDKLIKHENNIKLMIGNLGENAKRLNIQKNILQTNHPAQYTMRVIHEIKKREDEITAKVNEINIIFKKLFHRRRKMANVPTVWIK